jgi:hypothetical protein
MSRCVSASERWGYITAASRDCLGSECQSTDRFICVSPSCGIKHLLSFRTPDVIVEGLRAYEILDQGISWKHIRVSSGYRFLHSPDEIGLAPILLSKFDPICASYIRRYSRARVSNIASFTLSGWKCTKPPHQIRLHPLLLSAAGWPSWRSWGSPTGSIALMS